MYHIEFHTVKYYRSNTVRFNFIGFFPWSHNSLGKSRIYTNYISYYIMADLRLNSLKSKRYYFQKFCYHIFECQKLTWKTKILIFRLRNNQKLLIINLKIENFEKLICHQNELLNPDWTRCNLRNFHSLIKSYEAYSISEHQRL